MLGNYLPILIFIVIGIAFSIAPIIFGTLIAPKNPNKEKNSAYECGYEASSNSRIQFNIRYYLVAILFIIFELEVIFLFPWAANIKSIPWSGFIAAMIFLGFLAVGFIYEWKKGALEWE